MVPSASLWVRGLKWSVDSSTNGHKLVDRATITFVVIKYSLPCHSRSSTTTIAGLNVRPAVNWWSSSHPSRPPSPPRSSWTWFEQQEEHHMCGRDEVFVVVVVRIVAWLLQFVRSLINCETNKTTRIYGQSIGGRTRHGAEEAVRPATVRRRRRRLYLSRWLRETPGRDSSRDLVHLQYTFLFGVFLHVIFIIIPLPRSLEHRHSNTVWSTAVNRSSSWWSSS